jgi:acyl-coenzyme A thioesterase PaaI-like protein
MSFYQKLAEVGTKYIPKHKLFKHGFNLSPMYRRSTGRILSVSEDLLHVRIRLPISYKNRNYVNSIFGGSLFSAVDPIPMVQLINLLDNTYVVWDKSAEVYFKKPAREHLFADFTYAPTELEEIKNQVSQNQETEIIKTTQLTNQEGTQVYCEVRKTIYIANKQFFKEKRKQRADQ